MKSKKILAMLLVAAMTAGCLAGCGQQAETNKESEKASESKVEESQAETSSVVQEEPSLFNAGGQLPIVNEPVTLKVLTIEDPTHSMGSKKDCLYWDWLTEQTGIQFEVETYLKEDMATKLPLIMAGDDLPDIFLACNFTYGDLEGYANAGKILSMNDLIEEYGYYTQEVFEERPDAIGAFYAADGNCYGLPQVTSSLSAGYCNYGINQGWLDNLGLPVPTTLEELYEVLVAFKEQDANGNGDPNDEIPWSIIAGDMNTVMWTHSTVGIATYWPISGAMFDEKDDEVFLVNTSDQYRELLTFMNKCYEEGLLIETAFTQSSAEQNALRREDRVGLASLVGELDWTAEACGKVVTWTGLSIGCEKYAPVSGRGAAYNPNIFHISATTEYPEVCFLLGDYLFSEEATWLSEYGIPGKAFNWTDEANFQWKKEEGHKNDYRLFANCYIRDEWTQNPVSEINAVYMDKLNQVSKMAFQHFLVTTPEEADQISVLGTDLTSVLDEYYVHFITGEKDIEKDWDEYVKLVDSLKGKELTDLYQEIYNRFIGK